MVIEQQKMDGFLRSPHAQFANRNLIPRPTGVVPPGAKILVQWFQKIADG